MNPWTYSCSAFFSAVIAQLFLAPSLTVIYKSLMITAISAAALGCLWFALASSALDILPEL